MIDSGQDYLTNILNEVNEKPFDGLNGVGVM